MTTSKDVLIDLCDYYHDRIDGYDPVEHVTYDDSEDPPGVQVMFESGATVWITATVI